MATTRITKYLQFSIFVFLVSLNYFGSVASVRCDIGEYLHGAYDDYSDEIKPGAECRRCPKETYNTARNNTSIRCSSCRQPCNAERGEIEIQPCRSDKNRICGCDPDKHLQNADVRRPNSHLVCSCKEGKIRKLDSNGVVKCYDDPDASPPIETLVTPPGSSKNNSPDTPNEDTSDLPKNTNKDPKSEDSSPNETLWVLIIIPIAALIVVIIICRVKYPEKWRRFCHRCRNCLPCKARHAPLRNGNIPNRGETALMLPAAHNGHVVCVSRRESMVSVAVGTDDFTDGRPAHDDNLDSDETFMLTSSGSSASHRPSEPINGLPGNILLATTHQNVETDSVTAIDDLESLPQFAQTPPSPDAAETAVKIHPHNLELPPSQAQADISSSDDADAAQPDAVVVASSCNERSPMNLNLTLVTINQDNSKITTTNNVASTSIGNQSVLGGTNNFGNAHSAITWKANNIDLTHIKNELSPTVQHPFDELLNDSEHVFSGIMDVLMQTLAVCPLVTSHMLKYRLVNQPQYEEITNSKTPSDKSALTLFYVKKKETKGLAYFVLTLYRTHQSHVAYHIICALIERNDNRSLDMIVSEITKEKDTEDIVKSIQKSITSSKLT